MPRKVPLRIEPKTFFGASQLCTELQPVFCVVGWRAMTHNAALQRQPKQLP